MQSFYGKSADVFGAIPSLHVVYPFLATVYGWPLRRFRWVAVGYFLLVCFSAVYLNHHYLIDLFVGLGIALLVMAAARTLFGALHPRFFTTPEVVLENKRPSGGGDDQVHTPLGQPEG